MDLCGDRNEQHGTKNANTHNRTTQKTNTMGVNSCACEGYAVPEYNTQNIITEHMYYLFLTSDFDVLLYLQKSVNCYIVK